MTSHYAHHRPYVVATPPLWHRLDKKPLGVELSDSSWVDPTRASCERFIDRLDRLDAETFGLLGMRMPRWALYDCAALPGAIIGLAVETDAGLEPVTMCLLTPRLGPDEWLAYSISSLPLDPELEVESLALAFCAVGARRVLATTQWSSPRLDVHARFAPLELLASWIPAHTSATSFVYALDVDPPRIERARAGSLEPVARGEPVDAGDVARLHVIQARIESGVRVELVGAERHGDGFRALVREVA